MNRPPQKRRADASQVTHGMEASSPNMTHGVGADETASHSKPDPRQDWLGKKLGKYEITGFLGEGGMGLVMKGKDASIDRDVAIKILPAALCASENNLKRFQAEAKSTARNNHPNVVTIYEVGEEDTTHYLAMELVSGGSVADQIRQRDGYSVAEATRITAEAARGIAAAHKQGMVHRDIKPANLLMTEDGAIKVSDFGLAKHTEDHSTGMTKTGQVVGTPSFMSPEQCRSETIDFRSDVYALGATYYSLLTGRSPYDNSGSIVQVMFAHCNDPPPNPHDVRPGLPEACIKIVRRSMEKSPEDRYQTMDEMRADLDSLLSALSGENVALPSQAAEVDEPVPPKQSAFASPSIRWLATIAVFAIVLITGFFLVGRNSDPPLNPAVSSPDLASPSIPVVPPGFSGDPIRVGILHSLTGTMAQSESPVVDALLLAIAQTNEAGGLLGREIQPVVADGRSDWPTFERQAKRLIEEENVCTVFGCWTSASRKTVVPIFEDNDHLLLYPVQYEGVEESPNVIYTGATPNQQILPAVQWAFETEGKRKFFLVGSDYIFPHVANTIIKDQLESLGAEVVGEAFLKLGSSDVKPIIDQIRETKPDIILSSINGGSNTAFFNQLRTDASLSDISTLSFSIGEEELRFLDPAIMKNDYAAWNYFQSIESPANEQLLEAFHKRYGPQRVMTDPMASSYFGFQLWAKAVKDAGSLEPAAIRRAIRNQRIEAAEGLMRIDAATQHSYKTPRIGKVRPDGQFDVVWTAEEPVKPKPYTNSRTTEQWRAMLHDLYAGWNDHWAAPMDDDGANDDVSDNGSVDDDSDKQNESQK